jgi:RND family efflux transporter MFP subunit
MRKFRNIGLTAVVFLSLAIISCQPPGGAKEETPGTFGSTPVSVFVVKKQRIAEKLTFTGVIEAWKKINITPDIGGKISKIHVEEGDWVEKDQLLAELDTRAIRLQLEQANAALAVARANHKDAEKNLERLERLSREKAVSDQQFEKVKLAFEAAAAQLQQAQAAVNLAQHQVDVSIMEAPFRGVVASRNAEVGDVINPMMGGYSPTSGVMTIMDFSEVKIEIEVSQKDVVRIRKGQNALLRISAFPDRLFQGKISIVNQTADPMSKKFRVKVKAPNSEMILRPNTFGEVVIEVDVRPDALVIPQNALLENSFVYVAQGNKAVKKDVTVGLQNTLFLEILEGLDEGERVIVQGNYGLEDGVEIEVKEVMK